MRADSRSPLAADETQHVTRSYWDSRAASWSDTIFPHFRPTNAEIGLMTTGLDVAKSILVLGSTRALAEAAPDKTTAVDISPKMSQTISDVACDRITSPWSGDFAPGRTYDVILGHGSFNSCPLSMVGPSLDSLREKITDDGRMVLVLFTPDSCASAPGDLSQAIRQAIKDGSHEVSLDNLKWTDGPSRMSYWYPTVEMFEAYARNSGWVLESVVSYDGSEILHPVLTLVPDESVRRTS